MLFGTDSHTCNAGAFGQFATGVGNTDAGFILGTGKLLIKVPPTMRFVLDGTMPEYLLAKDLILQVRAAARLAGWLADVCACVMCCVLCIVCCCLCPSQAPTRSLPRSATHTHRHILSLLVTRSLPPPPRLVQIIGEIGVAGATYKAMEFVGSAIEGMNMDERMTVCNMVVEAGGKNGVIAPDQTTFDYVRARSADAFEPVYSDAGASYCADYK